MKTFSSTTYSSSSKGSSAKTLFSRTSFQKYDSKDSFSKTYFLLKVSKNESLFFILFKSINKDLSHFQHASMNLKNKILTSLKHGLILLHNHTYEKI